MFLRIQTSVSTMLEQQNLATMKALNAAFGNARAAAPAPAQTTRTAIANRNSAATPMALRQQLAAAADAAANAANASGAGQTKSLSDQSMPVQLQFGAKTSNAQESGMADETAPLNAIASGVVITNAALSAAQAAYAEVSNPLNQ